MLSLGERHARKETDCVKAYDYEALEDSANLPDPGVIARDIMEDQQAALEQFATIAEDFNEGPDKATL